MYRLLRDAEYFEQKLGKIDGIGDTGTYLVNIVKEKNVAVPPPTSAPATPLIPQKPASEATAPALPTRTPSTSNSPVPGEKEDAKKAVCRCGEIK